MANIKIIKLAKNMNMQSTIKVPLVPSIIKCFKLTFTDLEIDTMLKLKTNYRYQKNELSFIDEKLFSSLLNKGGIWFKKLQYNEYYELAPIFPGWIEVFLSAPLDDLRLEVMNEFAKFDEFLKNVNIGPVRALMNHNALMKLQDSPAHMSTAINNQKIINLNIPLEAQNEIISKGEVTSILKRNKEHLAVMNCFCRIMADLKKDPCRFNMDKRTCINVGGFADAMVKYGISEKITYDEAITIIDDSSKKGAIHTVFHYNNNVNNDEIVICNCCSDCCTLYGLFNKGSISSIFVKAYYEPKIINQDKCVGCNLCQKYCPVNATYYDKEQKKLIFNEKECIGCGQCVLKCNFNVRELIYNPRNVFVSTRSHKNKKY